MLSNGITKETSIGHYNPMWSSCSMWFPITFGRDTIQLSWANSFVVRSTLCRIDIGCVPIQYGATRCHNSSTLCCNSWWFASQTDRCKMISSQLRRCYLSLIPFLFFFAAKLCNEHTAFAKHGDCIPNSSNLGQHRTGYPTGTWCVCVVWTGGCNKGARSCQRLRAALQSWAGF